MSPDNKKKLKKLRKKLDLLDNQLLRLIKIRTNLVKEVLKLKIYNENVKPIEKKIETQLKSMNSIIKTITYKP